MTPGDYTTHWQMMQEGVAWFGHELTLNITVVVPEPSSWTIMLTAGLAVVAGVVARVRRNRHLP
jgi:hypothetical protein